jgi:hypothetical protein
MRFSPHYELRDKHAQLSASQYSWIRYDEDKLARVFYTSQEKMLGTRKHAWAAETIRLGIKQAKTQRTLNMYVNDCIGHKLEPEVPLVGVEGLAFGTADAVGYNERKGILYIFDLKTGALPTSFDQLRVYAAFFFMEYGLELGITPFDINIELRIYQNNEILIDVESHDEIVHIIDQIKMADRLFKTIREEAML